MTKKKHLKQTNELFSCTVKMLDEISFKTEEMLLVLCFWCVASQQQLKQMEEVLFRIKKLWWNETIGKRKKGFDRHH